jgi:hypothetical protein
MCFPLQADVKTAKYLGHNQIETLADHDKAGVQFFGRPGRREATR